MPCFLCFDASSHAMTGTFSARESARATQVYGDSMEGLLRALLRAKESFASLRVQVSCNCFCIRLNWRTARAVLGAELGRRIEIVLLCISKLDIRSLT